MIAIPLKTTAVDALRAPTGSALAQLGSRVWRALETAGQRRAARELRERAAFHAASNPTLAAEFLAAANHCNVAR